jgi:tetratricopeptide (TPR) repeat protein
MRIDLRAVGAIVGIMVGLAAIGYGMSQWWVRRSVENGVRLLSRGDYAAAVRALLPAVSSRPGDARAHYYLGLAYSGIGLREGALAQLNQAIRLAPNEARFHEGLGEAYRESGEPARALDEFKAAMRLAPREPRYEVAVAGALLDQGRLAEAVGELRQALGEFTQQELRSGTDGCR